MNDLSGPESRPLFSSQSPCQHKYTTFISWLAEGVLSCFEELQLKLPFHPSERSYRPAIVQVARVYCTGRQKQDNWRQTSYLELENQDWYFYRLLLLLLLFFNTALHSAVAEKPGAVTSHTTDTTSPQPLTWPKRWVYNILFLWKVGNMRLFPDSFQITGSNFRKP